MAELKKYEAIKRYLLGEYIFVYVNTKAKGLDIPAHLMAGDTVTLKLSTLFQGGMEVTETEITANLLFSGSYYNCFIPLDSIWGIADDKGANYIWPDAVPDALLPEVLTHIAGQSTGTSDKAPLPSRGHLRRVK